MCVKIRRSYSMYGSIGELLSLFFLLLPPLLLVGFYDAEISRRPSLSNIAGRHFLRRHVYPALCRILEERERERKREGEGAMTTTGTKYITCFPLKKQI